METKQDTEEPKINEQKSTNTFIRLKELQSLLKKESALRELCKI